MFTKYTDRSILNMAMGKMNMHFMNGRSEVAPAAMGTPTNADSHRVQSLPSAILTECNHYRVQFTQRRPISFGHHPETYDVQSMLYSTCL